MTTIPTIAQLEANILAKLRSEYRVVLNPLGDAFLVGLAVVLSGILWLFYQALAGVQKNVWYTTADSEKSGGTLEEFGRSILDRDPFQAGAGEYTASVTGSVGATIDAVTTFLSDDASDHPGMMFQITGAYTLAGSDVINIVALKGGTASRLSAGDTLTATAPIANVNSVITILSEVTAPTDAETIEEYRAKIDTKVKTEPGSWNAADYRKVGLGIPGVGQTYAYATVGATAEVDVYLQGTTPIAYPGPSVAGSVITAYGAALDLVRPLTVFNANIAACTIRNVDVTITMGAFTAFTSAQRAAINTALATFVNSVRPFIAACDAVADRNDSVAIYNLSRTISEAVPGYGFSAVTFTVAGSAETAWTADRGEIPYLNLVTYA